MSYPGRPRRSPLRMVVVAVLMILVVVVGAGTWLTWRGLQARDDLVGAAAELTAARSDALDGDLDAARAHLSEAARATSSARDKTSDPVWLLVGELPLVGDTPAAATTIARQADALADDVFPTLLSIVGVVEPASLSALRGSVDRDALSRVVPMVAQVQDDLRAIEAALATAADGWVIEPVADVLAEFQSEVGDVADTVDTVAEAIELLTG